MVKILLLIFLIPMAAYAQERKVLAPRKLSALLPKKIDGYTIQDESKASTMQVGSLRYTICERKFQSGKKSVKILLFDYGEAPIMFTQATKKWLEANETFTDSVTFSHRQFDRNHVWESTHPRSFRGQIIAAINNRFYLTVEGEMLTVEELRLIYAAIEITKFPE